MMQRDVLQPLLLVCLAATVLLPSAAWAAPPAESATEQSKISEAALRLRAELDAMDVEHHWLRGDERLHWRSGDDVHLPDGELPPPLRKDETHCSAFAAAAADRLGVYLLHPPEHSQVLLANAQFQWLESPKGAAAGWREIDDPWQAQQSANQGRLVVAVFRNEEANKPGHVAIVRPSDRTQESVERLGPQITQAGFTNYRSTTLKEGFSHHEGAWLAEGRGKVRFFGHDLPKDGGEPGT
jgi:hypothetical protein